MPSISNDTGRALEYCIVNELMNYFKSNKINFTLTSRATMDNTRDSIYFSKLGIQMQNGFCDCGKVFIKWTEKEKWFEGVTQITMDRLPDTAGIQGDTTDIRLTLVKGLSSEIKNVSIKHHHNALKHPRLPRLPEQCGISDIKIKDEYIKEHNLIWQNFKDKANKLSLNATKFSQVKTIDSTFVDKNLYKPLIELVIDFITENLKQEKNLKAFFQFLTGSTNFITIKNEEDCILIKHFEKIKVPKTFKITYPYKSLTTFLMELDNGWKITFRLHTATEEFLKHGKLDMSVKFDVICQNLDEVIEIEKIMK